MGSSVDVKITNAWTSAGDAVDSIFYEYKINEYDDKCFEKENVDGGGVVDNITISAFTPSPTLAWRSVLPTTTGPPPMETMRQFPSAANPISRPMVKLCATN